jgi:hypothetical protein
LEISSTVQLNHNIPPPTEKPFARKERITMAQDRHIYGKVNNESGMRRIFTEIRHNVAEAKSRPALTELYKRAGYLIALTQAPSWEEKFGRKAGALRRVGKEEFHKTAMKINRRAKQIGTESDYDDKWGE